MPFTELKDRGVIEYYSKHKSVIDSDLKKSEAFHHAVAMWKAVHSKINFPLNSQESVNIFWTCRKMAYKYQDSTLSVLEGMIPSVKQMFREYESMILGELEFNIHQPLKESVFTFTINHPSYGSLGQPEIIELMGLVHGSLLYEFEISNKDLCDVFILKYKIKDIIESIKIDNIDDTHVTIRRKR